MTNNQIIFQNAIALAEAGILKTDENGLLETHTRPYKKGRNRDARRNVS